MKGDERSDVADSSKRIYNHKSFKSYVVFASFYADMNILTTIQYTALQIQIRL
jgi:hypothetical protein